MQYPVKIIRKNIKNSYLRVKRDKNNGELYIQITCNKGMKNDEIDNFIAKSQAYIDRTVDKLNKARDSKIDQFKNGQHIKLWGKSYILKIEKAKIANRYCNYKISFDELGERSFDSQDLNAANYGIAKLMVPACSNFDQQSKFLNNFYTAQAKDKLATLARIWEGRTNLYANSYKFRFMKSRWGSCNHKTKNITLNTELAKLNPVYFEYVLLHEIAHLKVPNHGFKFYELLDCYMPNWKDLRKELRQIELGNI